ncbi:hypothetical protein PQO03_12010 [Lentisphaera profundi]|uniref:PhoD-like phosphatase metallophosphatase domain-containing protein n=1 Tax=Lentisphaera profundi TaxID=1658616 RepID=A0ABY7VZ63_9BACT|nr:hypothetical protein [Lentisphaera profundi]WDE98564.1 hypothetical protein PQO03_12010 [Lentisphaera profundi]
MNFKMSLLGLSLSLLSSVNLSASSIDYNPLPFGDSARAKVLETLTTGKWWEKKANNIHQKFIAERERSKAIGFAFYAQDHGVLKLTLQCFPLLPEEPKSITLEIKEKGQWKKLATQPVLYPGWDSHFRIENWDSSKTVDYRVKLGELSTFEGTFRSDPKDKKEITVASMSCNSPHDETPYQRAEYIKNLKVHNPDLLFFAGDQSYNHKEHTYAFLQFGVQFAEIMKDRPTIMIPDDHDIGQANFWGNGGTVADHTDGSSGGYYYPSSYVKMVERQQTFNLPDAYDPTPIKHGIGVYYTDLNVGGIDFAIIEDRKFKTGPKGTIPKMGPRPDHINDPSYDREAVDLPGLKLLGDRQLKFLNQWSQDWTGAQMKAVLSQTAFTGAVHKHGKLKNRLLADLDSNAWPQTGRNNALREIRRGLATHLCGDQHLGVSVQHGIDNFRDGPYAFTNPALVNTIYGRWWWPENEQAGSGEKIDGPLPWTGDYLDGLGNKVTMLAYANPKYATMRELRNNRTSRADGYGLVRFNKSNNKVTFECWPRFCDVRKGDSVQFPGWPISFQMEENDGRKIVGHLPTLSFNIENPVVQVIEEATGEILYTRRIQGKEFSAPVYAQGKYTIKAGLGKADQWSQKSLQTNSSQTIAVELK